MENETTLELDYLKIEVNSETTAEVDKYNFIYKVNGTDYLAAVRRAVGL